MFNIVLLEPRIPGNVGTIGRLAFALNCTLHLIKPYGFGEITEKEVRRAGLDYWFELDVREYENIENFLTDIENKLKKMDKDFSFDNLCAIWTMEDNYITEL